MKIKNLFSVLLFLSSLTSAMDIPGSISDPRFRKREAVETVWAVGERSRMDEERRQVVDLQRGNRIRAVDPTMFPIAEDAPDEDEVEQKKTQVQEVLKGYTDENSILYGQKAMEALNESSRLAKVNSDDTENFDVSYSNHEKMVNINHQLIAAYKSIACDYMDAANAEEHEDKLSRPYLKAIEVQKKMINALAMLKKEMENRTLTPASEEKQREEIQKLRAVAINVRTTNSFGMEDQNYAGPRFFPEMPH